MRIKNRVKNALIWSQKYTQTDMVYIAKGGSWLLMGQTVSFLANLLIIIAFANWVSKETFGTYKYVLSLFGILSIPSLSGLNAAVLRAAAQGEDGSFVPAVKMKLKWGFLGSLGSLAVAGYYLLKGNEILAVCFLIIAAFLPFFNSFLLYDSFLVGKKRFGLQNQFGALSQIISLAFVIAALFFTKNIFLILLAYFFPLALIYLLFLLITLKKFHPQGTLNPKTMSFGKHLSLLDVLAVLNSQVDRILIWHFLGAGPVAVYSIAMVMPDKIKEILKTIGTLAMPKLSARPIDELKKSVPQKTIKLFYIAVPIMLAYIFLAPLLFKWFFPQYQQFVKYSQVYALILLTYPRLLAGSSLVAQKRTKDMFIATITLSPVYWILLLSLVPSLGIWGAIAAFLILEAITFFVQYWQFKRIKCS